MRLTEKQSFGANHGFASFETGTASRSLVFEADAPFLQCNPLPTPFVDTELQAQTPSADYAAGASNLEPDNRARVLALGPALNPCLAPSDCLRVIAGNRAEGYSVALRVSPSF